jgi:hypothetical protein
VIGLNMLSRVRMQITRVLIVTSVMVKFLIVPLYLRALIEGYTQSNFLSSLIPNFISKRNSLTTLMLTRTLGIAYTKTSKGRMIRYIRRA